jgi:hypothetical protein
VCRPPHQHPLHSSDSMPLEELLCLLKLILRFILHPLWVSKHIRISGNPFPQVENTNYLLVPWLCSSTPFPDAWRRISGSMGAAANLNVLEHVKTLLRKLFQGCVGIALEFVDHSDVSDSNSADNPSEGTDIGSSRQGSICLSSRFCIALFFCEV